MNPSDSICAALLDYLNSSPVAASPIGPETDLLESGRLDSMLVVDLVCFLEARFQVFMEPADINPRNLRTVARLARYVHARQSRGADAA